MPDVSILMVGYNSAPFLPACLASLGQGVRRPAFELLFIDNGSDGSERLVSELVPGVRILSGRGNIGFGAANNLLGAQARGEFLLLLNPDTRLLPEAVDRLIDAARDHPQFGILGGSTLLDMQGETMMPPLELPDHRTILRSMVRRARQPVRGAVNECVVPASATSGGFMLVRHELWQALGGFDERYFLYGEDLDLCRRAAVSGWKVGSVATARVYHDVGSGEFGSARRLLLRARGTATYHHSHFPAWRAWVHVMLMWIALLPRMALPALLQAAGPHWRSRFRSIAPLVFKPWQWMCGFPARR